MPQSFRKLTNLIKSTNFIKSTTLGQSLVEYSIAIALIAMVAIGSLTLMSGNLGEQMGFFANKFSGEQAQDVVVNGNLIMGIDPYIPGAIPNTSTVNVQLSNGSSITLPNYPEDLALSVETLGTNGTLNLMLANVDAMIAQLEADGMDEAKINQLKGLSSQGHRMANLEGAIEEAYNNADSIEAFMATEVDWDGTRLTVDDLGHTHLGFNGIRPHSGIMDIDVLSSTPEVYYSVPADVPRTLLAHPETQAFIDLYNEAKASGALDDPVLQDVIHTMGTEVTVLSSTIQDLTGDLKCIDTNGRNFCLANGARPLSADVPYDVWMKEYMVSGATHMNSHGICRAGAPQKEGINCQ